jgi:hypothetical protein
VKISSFVPDQRNVPGTAGSMRKNGAVTGWGMRPSTTMGSEKVTRISFACSMSVISPSGPVWRTASSWARAGAAASSAAATTTEAHPIFIRDPPRGSKSLYCARPHSKSVAGRKCPQTSDLPRLARGRQWTARGQGDTAAH